MAELPALRRRAPPSPHPRRMCPSRGATMSGLRVPAAWRPPARGRRIACGASSGRPMLMTESMLGSFGRGRHALDVGAADAAALTGVRVADVPGCPTECRSGCWPASSTSALVSPPRDLMVQSRDALSSAAPTSSAGCAPAPRPPVHRPRRGSDGRRVVHVDPVSESTCSIASCTRRQAAASEIVRCASFIPPPHHAGTHQLRESSRCEHMPRQARRVPARTSLPRPRRIPLRRVHRHSIHPRENSHCLVGGLPRCRPSRAPDHRWSTRDRF